MRKLADTPSVYFIGPCDRGLATVKIGRTGGLPAKRLASLQTGSPHELTLYGTVEMDGTYYEEALHLAFRPLRLHGEWFRYEGHLRLLIETMTQRYGSDQRWNSQEFWAAAIDVFRSLESKTTSEPRALAYIDQRILTLFPDGETIQ